jgi:hypothetical protein
MKIELRKLSEMKPYPGNPRINAVLDFAVHAQPRFGVGQPAGQELPNGR